MAQLSLTSAWAALPGEDDISSFNKAFKVNAHPEPDSQSLSEKSLIKQQIYMKQKKGLGDDWTM